MVCSLVVKEVRHLRFCLIRRDVFMELSKDCKGLFPFMCLQMWASLLIGNLTLSYETLRKYICIWSSWLTIRSEASWGKKHKFPIKTSVKPQNLPVFAIQTPIYSLYDWLHFSPLSSVYTWMQWQSMSSQMLPGEKASAWRRKTSLTLVRLLHAHCTINSLLEIGGKPFKYLTLFPIPYKWHLHSLVGTLTFQNNAWRVR